MRTTGQAGQIDVKIILRRLAKAAGVLVVGLYLFGVVGGYLFLRYGRKIEDVRLVDVALCRLGAIRRTQARQHFEQARQAWDAKDYQQAYVYYTSAVLRDPGNLEGRLAAARFLAALGATNLEVNLLEDGLARFPGDRQLNEMLFDRLLSVGRYQHALELLHGRHLAALTGPNAPYLQMVELRATLATSGAPAARALLARYPSLAGNGAAIPLVAEVWWQTGDRSQAIQLLAKHVESQPKDFPIHAQLCTWQHEAGPWQVALDTALKAVARFPQEAAARVLVLDVGADRIRGTPDWWREIGRYLKDFKADPKAVFLLAELAGRRGWLEVSGTLYELGARRSQDLGMLGLFYSDSLARNSRLGEVRTLLEEIEQQSAGRNLPFLLQLRQREIAVAAATSDREGVREYARRLAGLLRNDPDMLEQYRRHYQTLGLAEAVAELSDRAARPAPASVKKNT